MELKALDLEGQWTEERAQAWWRAHPPTGPEKPAAPRLDVDDSRQETQSRLEARPGILDGSRPGRRRRMRNGADGRYTLAVSSRCP